MKNFKLTKIIASTLMVSLVFVLNPILALAQVSQNEAENLIYENGKIFEGLNINPKFQKEVSKNTLPNYLQERGIYELTESDENLYYFSDIGQVRYYVGVNSGRLYAYGGGSGAGSFYWIENNKIIKEWYWERESGGTQNVEWKQLKGWILADSNNWYYYSNGVSQTGWIYDNGNWYYCYSNGQMARNTTIDGYYLGSSGAWIN